MGRFFKDGTSFSSNGKCEGIKKSSVSEEFKWVAFHIEKEIPDHILFSSIAYQSIIKNNRSRLIDLINII